MNNVFVTGYFQGTSDFGGGSLIALGADMFVAKYSPTGIPIWSSKYGAGMTQVGTAVAAKSNGNIAVTGMFQSTIDLGTGTKTSAGGMDVFVGTDIVP
jgi:hypothetical protein